LETEEARLTAKLVLMTEANGASPAEAAMARRKINQLAEVA
jgi:hypothetical protein